MKLQKLVYYSQAYHLVRFGGPLFADAVEAWANGPVVPTLYQRHKGEFVIRAGRLGACRLENLAPASQQSVRAAVGAFGGYTGAQLSALTHEELPWQQARHGLGPYDRSNRPITQESMRAYYGSQVRSHPLFAA